MFTKLTMQKLSNFFIQLWMKKFATVFYLSGFIGWQPLLISHFMRVETGLLFMFSLVQIVLICWLAGRQSWQFDFRTCMPEKSCWFVDRQTGRASICNSVCQRKCVDLLIGRPAELAIRFSNMYARKKLLIFWSADWQSWHKHSISEKLCWFVDWQAGRAGNSIFEHVCQKKAVDFLIGRPAELAQA